MLTNAHVVEGAEVVEVDLGERRAARSRARVVGADAESDVALLKVDAKRPLPVVPLGDSDRIAVAEWVLVIGSPFGLDHTVTLGIVSHTGRTDISPRRPARQLRLHPDRRVDQPGQLRRARR